MNPPKPTYSWEIPSSSAHPHNSPSFNIYYKVFNCFSNSLGFPNSFPGRSGCVPTFPFLTLTLFLLQFHYYRRTCQGVLAQSPNGHWAAEPHRSASFRNTAGVHCATVPAPDVQVLLPPAPTSASLETGQFQMNSLPDTRVDTYRGLFFWGGGG